MKNRLLAILISALMLTNLFAVTGLAYTLDEDKPAEAETAAAIGSWYIGKCSDMTSKLTATEVSGSNNESAATPGRYYADGNNAVMVYNVNMPEIPAGKILKYAEFRMTSYHTGSNTGMDIYAMPGGTWNFSDITWTDLGKYVYNKNYTGTAPTPIGVRSNDQGAANSLGGSYYRHMFDVTSYIKACIDAGQTSFWIGAAKSGTKMACSYNRGNTYGNVLLYYTLEDAPALALDSFTPADGAEGVSPSSDVIFTFNNTIKSATAKVNGVDVDAVSDGNVVTVDCDFAENTEYSVSVSVTDAYGSSLTEEITFTTGRDAEIFDELYEYGSQCYTDKDGAVTTSNLARISKDINKGNNGMVFYLIKLPEVKAGQFLSSYKLNFYVYDSTLAKAQLQAYAIPASYNEVKGLNIGKADRPDYDVTAIVDDYDTYKAGDAVLLDGDTVLADGYECNPWETDLTALARERIAAGDSEMYIGITCLNHNVKFGGTDASPRSYAIIENNPSIVVYAKSAPVVSGSNLASFGFGVYTDPAQLVDDVVIRKADGSEEITGKFVYNKFTNKIELSASVALDEDTDYAIVMKQGAADGMDNTLADDLQLAEFSTGKNIIIAQPKLVASTSGDAYADCVHLGAVAANDSIKAVSSMQNLSGADLIVKFVVAQYYDDELIAVTPAEVTLEAGCEAATVATDSVTISADADSVKAFVWYEDNRPIAMPATASVN